MQRGAEMADLSGMPRTRRLTPPGTVQHLITRFRNKEFRIAGRLERSEYLKRLGDALARTDWLLLAFAVMSSHMHLALLAGSARIDAMMRSLNTGFGLWLNRTQRRTGPVFEGRFHSITIPTDRAGQLIAYQHNNAVRAGVAPNAGASDWTSHRFYVGGQVAPPWLAVERGLDLAGFRPDERGRHAFASFVDSRATDGRDVELSGGDMAHRRARKRREMGGQVELCTERAVSPGTIESPVYTLPQTPLRPRWNGSVRELVRAVAAHTGVPETALNGRDRSRRVVQARRLALLVGARHLGRSQVEVAAQLGLSEPAASQLLSNQARLAEIADLAVLVALHLRGLPPNAS